LTLGSIDTRAVHIAPDGSVILAGTTSDPDFPVTVGAYDTTTNGFADGFVVKVDKGLSRILAATFIGGGLNDYLTSVTTDAEGKIYVAGFSNSGWKDYAQYPTTPGAFQERSAGNGRLDAVVTQFDPGLTRVLHSTYLGAIEDDRASEIALGIGSHERRLRIFARLARTVLVFRWAGPNARSRISRPCR
jgi:hypothetical protein